MRALPRRRRRSALAAAAAASAIAVISLGAALPASAAAGPAAERPVVMTHELREEIKNRIDAFLAKNDISGVSVAVVTPDPAGADPVITTFAAGHPSYGSTTPVDASTQFEIGSETKVFTADLLAYLVATGRVALDDPVQDYAPPGVVVPEWIDPQTGERTAITLGNLATHQAGLTDAPPNFWSKCNQEPDCVNPRPGYTQAMLWDAFESPCWEGQHCPLWKPGTDWLYSDWGFALLGTIVSNVIDPVDESQPPAFQSALDQTFLDDLGLASTVLETSDGARLAVPYAADGTQTFYWNNTNAYSGAGGLISDATDLGTWVAAHLGYAGPGAPYGVQTMADTLAPVSRISTRCSDPGTCTSDEFEMGLAWELHHAGAQGIRAAWAFKNGATEGTSSDTALAPSL
ncbi:serine hydrolase domain-containing protein [Agromyces soli]